MGMIYFASFDTVLFKGVQFKNDEYKITEKKMRARVG